MKQIKMDFQQDAVSSSPGCKVCFKHLVSICYETQCQISRP